MPFYAAILKHFPLLTAGENIIFQTDSPTSPLSLYIEGERAGLLWGIRKVRLDLLGHFGQATENKITRKAQSLLDSLGFLGH